MTYTLLILVNGNKFRDNTSLRILRQINHSSLNLVFHFLEGKAKAPSQIKADMFLLMLDEVDRLGCVYGNMKRADLTVRY